MPNENLLAITPIDGRYESRTKCLSDYFSEFALIKTRVEVEINWLILISKNKALSFIPNLSSGQEKKVLNIFNEFSIQDAREIKKIEKNHIDGPLGVRGRNSNNDLIREKLGWDYEQTLEEGIKKTYGWISYQISKELYGVAPYDDPDYNPYESAEVMAAG